MNYDAILSPDHVKQLEAHVAKTNSISRQKSSLASRTVFFFVSNLDKGPYNLPVYYRRDQQDPATANAGEKFVVSRHRRRMVSGSIQLAARIGTWNRYSTVCCR
jgi:hypothetical protein